MQGFSQFRLSRVETISNIRLQLSDHPALKGHGFGRAVAIVKHAASYSVTLTTEGRKNPSDAKVSQFRLSWVETISNIRLQSSDHPALKGHGFSRAVASIKRPASYSVILTTKGRKNPSDAKVANPDHPAEIIQPSGFEGARLQPCRCIPAIRRL